MGYNLYIGEAETQICLEERSARIVVAIRTHDQAPLNSTGDYRNVIFPGYLAWSGFTRKYGLYDCFYEKTWKALPDQDWYAGLLAAHPGAVALAEAHHDLFARTKAALPSDAPDLDFRRLDWLTWWTRWALDNCKYPTFANS